MTDGQFEHGETVWRKPWLRNDLNAQRRPEAVYGPTERVDGAGVDPGDMAEVDGAITLTPATLFLPHDQPVHPLDQWDVRGELYETVGDPTMGRIRNAFTGRRFRREVNVKKVGRG